MRIYIFIYVQYVLSDYISYFIIKQTGDKIIDYIYFYKIANVAVAKILKYINKYK